MQGVFKCEDVKGIEVPPSPQTVCKLETNAHNEQSDRNVRGWGVGGGAHFLPLDEVEQKVHCCRNKPVKHRLRAEE